MLSPCGPRSNSAPFAHRSAWRRSATRWEPRSSTPDLEIVPEQTEGDAFGRLILLYDPEGSDAWDGTIRLVAYIQADLDSHEAIDPLLPEVAWSWLSEALETHPEHMTALGGTVTATTSVRYGDISGPPRAHLELRASWTATSPAVGGHVQAFCEVLDTPRAYHPRESPT